MQWCVLITRRNSTFTHLFNFQGCRPPTSASNSSTTSRPSLALAHKMRGLRKDVQEKFSRLRSRSAERISKRSLSGRNSSPDRVSQRSTSICVDDEDEMESTAAATYSQGDFDAQRPPFRMTKSFSGLPAPLAPPVTYNGPFIGRARALVDYTPSPYDRDALKFNVGFFWFEPNCADHDNAKRPGQNPNVVTK